MRTVRLVCAVLLALPLIAFGGMNLLGIEGFEPPETQSMAGIDLLQAMRDGGLMTWVALSHVIVGVMMLVSRLRLLGALLQLPISLGIVAFHMTMMPEGNGIAIGMLVLNLVVICDPRLSMIGQKRIEV